MLEADAHALDVDLQPDGGAVDKLHGRKLCLVVAGPIQSRTCRFEIWSGRLWFTCQVSPAKTRLTVAINMTDEMRSILISSVLFDIQWEKKMNPLASNA